MILTQDSQKIEQIDNSSIQLFPHQLTAIYALSEIEKNHMIKTNVHQGAINTVTTNIGIYSDMVGAGKTLSMISLIHYSERPSAKIDIPEMVHNNYTMTISYSNFQEIHHIDSNLIVVPHNLVIQWRDAMLKFKDLKFTIIKTKKDIENFSVENDTSEIVLVSNNQLNKLYEKIAPPRPKRLRWNRIILDEPQILNNIYGSVGHFDYDFIWFICATPGDLFNYRYRRPTYLNSFFSTSHNSRMNEYSSCLVVKNHDDFVDDSLSLPQYVSQYILCKTPVYYNVVRNNLPTAAALERLRANDITGAIQTFACDTGSAANIITDLTKFYEDKIKRLEYNNSEINQNPYLDNSQKIEKIQRNNEKIAEFKSKITNITERISDTMCPICLDDIEHPKAITKCCQNSFCMSCILMTISASREQKCPICKNKLSRQNIFVEHGQEECKSSDTEEENPLKSKNAALAEFINSLEDDRKLIIFSYYDETFRKLTEYFNALDSQMNKNIAFLKGRVETQMSTIKKFNEGNIKVIMMNAEYCGSGLNLQMATDIVIYHKLPKTLENQVIGRAQRPGRNTPLRITYLKYDDEY